MSALLELAGVRLEIDIPDGGTVHPLQGVNLNLRNREAVGLVGESGSGKSMTLRAILRLLPRGGRQTAGEICFNGERIDDTADEIFETIRGRQISMIFQDPVSALSPLLPIGDQISDVYRYSFGASRKEGHDRALRLLEALDIPHPQQMARRYPHQMSGGMAQRVNIAMALVCEPQLLLADEPTTGLDVTTQMQVLELLTDQLQERAASLLFVSHDLRVVGKVCEKVGVMYAGVLMEFGRSDEIFSTPANPYTRRLLECARIEEGIAPRSIRGAVPKLDLIHRLCPFRDRCDQRIALCDREIPPVQVFYDGRMNRCHVT